MKFSFRKAMFCGAAAKLNSLAGVLRLRSGPVDNINKFSEWKRSVLGGGSNGAASGVGSGKGLFQHQLPSVANCCHQFDQYLALLQKQTPQLGQRAAVVVNQGGQVCSLTTYRTMATSSTDAAGPSGSGPKHTNRLINEKSPYLLQHAHNPVDWYPWGDEAIAKARAENKLIFLSVGYSTCHWCHVMEKESFESEEVAAIMNEYFVNVKVDREERPDIDKLYMTFILLINGSGGWPMSVWLTPDLAPVTGGTYFPPKDRWGMPGFTTILLKLKNKWASDGEDLKETGRSIIQAIQKNVEEKHKEEPELPLTV